MNYQIKYEKYKIKYFELKEQYGGNIKCRVCGFINSFKSSNDRCVKCGNILGIGKIETGKIPPQLMRKYRNISSEILKNQKKYHVSETDEQRRRKEKQHKRRAEIIKKIKEHKDNLEYIIERE